MKPSRDCLIRSVADIQLALSSLRIIIKEENFPGLNLGSISFPGHVSMGIPHKRVTEAGGEASSQNLELTVPREHTVEGDIVEDIEELLQVLEGLWFRKVP